MGGGDDPLFGIGVVVIGLLILGVFLAIGKWYPGSGAEQLDWRPTRSYEDEVELELQDVDQMLEAQNERRRESGRAERTEDDIHDQVREDRAFIDAYTDRVRRDDDERDSS